MIQVIHRAALLGLLAVAVMTRGVEAQETNRITISSALTQLRESGHSTLAQIFLMQLRGPRAPAELDELADSLVAVAIDYRRGDPLSKRRAASAARVTIAGAAASEEGIAYPRAFPRLVRIYEDAGEVGVEGATLWLMSLLPNAGPVLEYLEAVATSRDRAAFQAVTVLSRDMGPAGVARLRRLHREGEVTEPGAVEWLRRIAHQKGWS